MGTNIKRFKLCSELHTVKIIIEVILLTVTKNITLECDKTHHSEIFYAQQNEKLSRKFIIKFTAGGELLSLTSNDTVRAVVSYDGKILDTINAIVNTSANTAVITLTEKCTAYAGDVNIRVDITNGSIILSSSYIFIKVGPAPTGTLTPATARYIDPAALEALMCYPNLANNIMINAKNFKGTANWSKVNTGTIDVADAVLALSSQGSLGVYGKLSKAITLDGNGDNLVLIKIRAMSMSDTKIVPCWRLNINGDYIHPASVVTGNLTSDAASNVYWQLTESNKWQDLWLIARRPTAGKDFSLNAVGLFVQSTATVYISH